MISEDGTISGILERSQRLHMELLAQRVASAKSLHEAALARLQEALAEGDAEGWHGILEARFAEADALSAYMAALRAYSDTPSLLHVV